MRWFFQQAGPGILVLGAPLWTYFRIIVLYAYLGLKQGPGLAINQFNWALVIALPLIICVTLGKALQFSELKYSHLEEKEDRWSFLRHSYPSESTEEPLTDSDDGSLLHLPSLEIPTHLIWPRTQMLELLNSFSGLPVDSQVWAPSLVDHSLKKVKESPHLSLSF